MNSVFAARYYAIVSVCTPEHTSKATCVVLLNEDFLRKTDHSHVTLTHETPPEGEVTFVADCVYDGQSVEDLLQYEETIFEVLVRLEPLVQRFAYTSDGMVELAMHTDTHTHTTYNSWAC